MKTRLLVAVSLLTFSVAAQAIPPKPEKCPSAGAITAAGLTREVIEKDNDGLWVVGMMKNKYDTKDNWTFVVGRINAKDQNEAFTKATASLSSLSFQQGPVAMERINKWGCGYNNAAGYRTIAVTPSLQGMHVTTITHSFS